MQRQGEISLCLSVCLSISLSLSYQQSFQKRNQPLVVIRDEHAMKDDAVGMGLEMFLQASTSSEDDTRQDGFVGDYQERESSEASTGRMILVKEESEEVGDGETERQSFQFIQPAYDPQIDQPPIEGPSFVLSPQEMLLQIVKQEDKNIMDTNRPEDVASSNSNDHVDFEVIWILRATEGQRDKETKR